MRIFSQRHRGTLPLYSLCTPLLGHNNLHQENSKEAGERKYAYFNNLIEYIYIYTHIKIMSDGQNRAIQQQLIRYHIMSGSIIIIIL